MFSYYKDKKKLGSGQKKYPKKIGYIKTVFLE